MISAMSTNTMPPNQRRGSARILLASALSLTLLASIQAQTPDYFVTRLPKPDGPHPVGQMSTVMVDRSRVDPLYPQTEQSSKQWGDQPRRLPVSFWYPARPTTAPDREYISDVREAEIARSLGQAGLVGAAGYLKTNASDHASLAVGKFPLLMFSPGFGFPAEFYQAYAEQLASAGFIVAAVHSPGINGLVTLDGRRYPSPAEVPLKLEETTALNDVMTEDLVAVLRLMRKGAGMPSLRLFRAIDFGRVGAFGHSFGASAALRLAARDKGVKAVAVLDGTIWGKDHLAGVETNGLFLKSRGNFEDPTINLAYRRLKGRAIICRQLDVAHGGLSDLYFINRIFEGPSADVGGADVGKRPRQNTILTRQLLTLYFGVELQGKRVAELTDFFKDHPEQEGRPGFTSQTKGF